MSKTRAAGAGRTHLLFACLGSGVVEEFEDESVGEVSVCFI